MHKSLWALMALLLASGAAAAKDDTCAKIKGFTIGLTQVDDSYTMPIGIAGTPRQFIFELNAAYTKMDEAIATELNLATKSVPSGMHVSDSEGPFTKIAKVPYITLGPVSRKDAEILIGAHRQAWGQKTSGAAGINILYGLDIELDLANDRLGLYLPRDDCEFTPIWPAAEWGNGDIKIAPTGTFFLNMNLDDKKLVVTVNPSYRITFMPFETARSIFGIAENDPRLIPAGFRIGDKDAYRFPFKALSGGHNVTVTAPEIFIIGNEQTCGGVKDQRNWNEPWSNKCYGSGDLSLGINLLKKLHFFFAMKEKKVYFSLSDQPPTK